MISMQELDTPVFKKVKIEGGEDIVIELTHEITYTTQGGRERKTPVLGTYDLLRHNLEYLNQILGNLRDSNLPQSTEYKGNEYKISDNARTELREKIDIFEEGETFEHSAVGKSVIITVEDAKNIRRQMAVESQVVLKKYNYISEKMLMIKTIEDVEGFDIYAEWNEA